MNNNNIKTLILLNKSKQILLSVYTFIYKTAYTYDINSKHLRILWDKNCLHEILTSFISNQYHSINGWTFYELRHKPSTIFHIQLTKLDKVYNHQSNKSNTNRQYHILKTHNLHTHNKDQKKNQQSTKHRKIQHNQEPQTIQHNQEKQELVKRLKIDIIAMNQEWSEKDYTLFA